MEKTRKEKKTTGKEKTKKQKRRTPIGSNITTNVTNGRDLKSFVKNKNCCKFVKKRQHITILTIYTILVGIIAMPKISPPLVTSATRRRRYPLVVKGSQYSTNQTLDESFSASIEPRNSRHKSSKGTSSGNGERTR